MIFIIIAAVIFAAYVLIENTAVLTMRHEDFGGDIKIAHISDLHKRSFGKGNINICKKIKAENPDLIFISGDLTSRFCLNFSNVEEMLKNLCKIAPVYFIFGNHETSMPDESKARFIKLIENSDAVWLNNCCKTVEINGRRLNICGMELKYSVYKNNDSYRNLEETSADEIRETIGEKPDGETILLVHNPIFADAYAEWGADYAVCGHVHGGVIRIPFTRIGVLSPERRFFPKYTKGVYKTGRMKLLVSAGLGKLRLFNPPEIVIYKL